ncbi:C39 family peptidase [Enterococcus malodoratus]|uniref:C39 family peptidase n=1 Tax=Enterococcus malodoratus TaxID=71451 RepID=UPI002072B4EA|nr:C39 family peptidase [Enterococcus malodoratus]
MEKKRFRMYKRKKTWVVAPIIFLGLLGASAFATDEHAAYADEVGKEQIVQVVEPESAAVVEAAPLNENQVSDVGGEVTETPPSTETTEPVEPSTPTETDGPGGTTEQETPIEEPKETDETKSTDEEEVTDPKEVDENKTEDSTVPDATEVVEKPIVDSSAKQEATTNKNTVASTPPKAATAAPKAAVASTPKAETKAAVAPTIAIYRVYNPNSGEHLHTMNLNEKNYLVKLGWRYEGIAWHTPWAGMPMYRVFNPNSRGAGSHHYTMLLSERNALIKVGWRNEGISWYTLGGAPPIAPVQRTLNVPYVSQYVPVFSPWGCAGASMTMLLKYKGKNVDLKYVQDHLPMYPNDKGGQKGNVYTGAGFGWVITPDSLANYAKKWYKNVSNISNISTQNIVDRIINGNPVLYYGYSSYQANTIRNHCKVIAGYKDNKFLVYDPLYYSSSAKAGSGGPNKTYDRGAMAWVSITDFAKEWDGRAIGIS